MHLTYLTTEEAAEYLKVSKRYLEQLRCEGGGPEFVAFGKAIRYRTPDLDAYAASKKRRSTSERGLAA